MKIQHSAPLLYLLYFSRGENAREAASKHQKNVFTKSACDNLHDVLVCVIRHRWSGGAGGLEPGIEGAGSLRDAGESGTGSGISKVAGTGRKMIKFRNIE